MQRICDLPWHEDLDDAVTAARRSGRPILSLRLLGRLDEELSCANSRFFRTTLYPAQMVARLLGDRFVLHWTGVRPVPRITIDFGDGRVMERTITGNSAHLVLDPRGRPVDVIPGLYDAGAFTRLCGAAADLAVATASVEADQRRGRLSRWHAARRDTILRAWAADLRSVGRGGRADAASLEAATDDAAWSALASLRAAEALPDAGVRATLAPRVASAREAGRIAVTKMVVERPMLDALLPLARSIAEDAVRNEYTLHRRVHELFASGAAVASVGGAKELCDWVYRELFLMPPDDPWLGLKADAYAGLVAMA